MIQDFYGEFSVKCPVCGMQETHHGSVISYERENGEDSQTIGKKVGSESSFMTDHNPSRRRNAVGINFSCEGGHHFNMNIVQHKGNTFIEFEETKTPI